MMSVYILTPLVYFWVLEPIAKWAIRSSNRRQAYLRSLPPAEEDHRGIPVSLLKEGKYLTPEAVKFLKNKR